VPLFVLIDVVVDCLVSPLSSILKDQHHQWQELKVSLIHQLFDCSYRSPGEVAIGDYVDMAVNLVVSLPRR
jgi:hypothetical protein